MGFRLMGGLARNSNAPSIQISAADSQNWTMQSRNFQDDTFYGLGVSFSGASRFSFELAGMYFNREILYTAYSENETDPALQTQARTQPLQVIHLPAQLRMKMGRFISFSLGGYYDYSLSSWYDYDLGLTAGARIRVPIKGALGIYAEGVYNYGLVDFAEVGPTQQTMFVFGVSWRD